MMQYQVKITLTETYTTWVEAESEDVAIEMAEKQFSNGELALSSESYHSDIIDMYDEDE